MFSLQEGGQLWKVRMPLPKPASNDAMPADLQTLAARMREAYNANAAGMLWFWPEQGWHHSHAMWLTELGWLSSHFRCSLLVQEPAQATAKILEYLNDWVVVRSGWKQSDIQLKLLSREASLQGQLAQTYVAGQDYLLAAMFTVFTFVVRLTVLTLATPLFLLAVLTGMVDGLMRRDLRKFGVDRESSFVYHRAKRTLLPLIVGPWVVYLALPWSVNPILVLLPCAALLG